MGTRSDIIVHRADGSWKRVYCHWDGYVSHHGPILTQHYNEQLKADLLVGPGDMSSLNIRCDKPARHTYDKPHKDCTVYYGRDRGETEVEGTVGKTLKGVWPDPDCWTEFTYVWTKGCWWVTAPGKGPKSLLKLQDVMDGKASLEGVPVKAFGAVIGKHGPQKVSK